MYERPLSRIAPNGFSGRIMLKKGLTRLAKVYSESNDKLRSGKIFIDEKLKFSEIIKNTY